MYVASNTLNFSRIRGTGIIWKHDSWKSHPWHCLCHLLAILGNTIFKNLNHFSFLAQTDDSPNSYMANGNFTRVTEFILTGVSERPDLQIPLFFVFLVIYGLTVTGNLSIITLTSVDSRLQTPMYFFLRHLAIINLGNSTVIAPKMLINFLVKKHTTSYYECAIQLGGFLVFIVAECSC